MLCGNICKRDIEIKKKKHDEQMSIIHSHNTMIINKAIKYIHVYVYKI